MRKRARAREREREKERERERARERVRESARGRESQEGQEGGCVSAHAPLSIARPTRTCARRLQLRGSKVWTICEPPPAASDGWPPLNWDGGPSGCQDLTMRAGDALYIPWGFPHRALTHDAAADHITLHPYTHDPPPRAERSGAVIAPVERWLRWRVERASEEAAGRTRTPADLATARAVLKQAQVIDDPIAPPPPRLASPALHTLAGMAVVLTSLVMVHARRASWTPPSLCTRSLSPS